MKRNKLLIAMGLAGAVLMGCNSSDSDKTEVTAIDGYIVKGKVTMTCGDDTFTGFTDGSGVASIDTSFYSAADCTALIEGVAGTYDYDQGADTPWMHTMKTLPGLTVINPFTDIAALLVENDSTLEGTALTEEVYKTLGIDASLIPASTDLFVDFGTNNKNRSNELVKASALAETTFAQIVKIKETVKVKEAKGVKVTVQDLITDYKTVLPLVSKAVDDYINNPDNSDLDLTKDGLSISSNIFTSDSDGNITVLENLEIQIKKVAKPATPATPAIPGTPGTPATPAIPATPATPATGASS